MARRINKIVPERCDLVKKIAVDLYTKAYPDWSIISWRIVCARHRAGFCRCADQTIVIPNWIFGRKDSEAYLIYYIAHELAHIRSTDVHGPSFMAEFKKICPEEYQHYEHGYKPRNAKAAGIREPKTKEEPKLLKWKRSTPGHYVSECRRFKIEPEYTFGYLGRRKVHCYRLIDGLAPHARYWKIRQCKAAAEKLVK